MEVIITVLLCSLVFALYLLHKSREEVSALKDELQHWRTKNFDGGLLSSGQVQPLKTDKNTFVRVIFRRDADKYYDYLLGNVNDVHVGDFVEVYVSKKSDNEYGSPQLLVAQIIYISAPGEISEYAKSKIRRKSRRQKW